MKKHLTNKLLKLGAKKKKTMVEEYYYHTYHLASAVHALQRNYTQKKHCPTNYRKKEYPSLAYEFKASSKSKKSVYV